MVGLATRAAGLGNPLNFISLGPVAKFNFFCDGGKRGFPLETLYCLGVVANATLAAVAAALGPGAARFYRMTAPVKLDCLVGGCPFFAYAKAGWWV